MNVHPTLSYAKIWSPDLGISVVARKPQLLIQDMVD